MLSPKNDDPRQDEPTRAGVRDQIQLRRNYPAPDFPHASEAIERASEDDRCWFEANPEYSWRIRPMVHGEFGRYQHEIKGTFVRVVQVRPGIRVRRPITLVSVFHDPGYIQ